MTATMNSRASHWADRPLCARGIHEDTPENEYRPPRGYSNERRCRPCRLEYNRLRRKGVAWVTHTRPLREAEGPLTPSEVIELRTRIPCLGCGEAPRRGYSGKVATPHKAGCSVASIAEG